ncbi:MAG TPA: UvrB/UvrC motif-containing protein [Candidatus Brocadiia bacterium]|nr:UvrB/UvrC motif-containing protein [Candidatus Brocadiia bacterium]
MSEDIKHILKSWPADGEGNVRKIMGDDGREKLQIRVKMATYHGLFQLECDGRPDGEEPHGFLFALLYHENRLAEHVKAGRSEDDFKLSHEEATELFDEGFMMYQRYILLLNMNDFARVIRDTEHNMRIFRLCNQRAELKEDRHYLEKWWPYIIRIHYTAKCLRALQKGDNFEALKNVKTAIELIDELDECDEETFAFERERSITTLNNLLEAIENQSPTDEIFVLQNLLEEAVGREEYERAAVIRDRINALRTSSDRAPDVMRERGGQGGA